MTDYASEVNNVASAMNAVYENKQVNKKTDLSGDYSTDNESYPTVKGLKNLLNNSYLTETEINTLLSSYTTTNALNNLLNAKVNVTDIVDNLTSNDTNKPLSANQGKVLKGLIDNKDLSSKDISIRKLATADTGYASSYVISQGGTDLTPHINIEKDKMLRSISVETVGQTPTEEEASYDMTAGDQYILMIVNTVDNDGTSRVILPITDVFDLQTADESTLTLSVGGVFSIKNGGVGLNQIAQAVKDSWLTNSDVQSEITSFANALANAINPSS